MISFTKMTLAEVCLNASAKYTRRRAFELFSEGAVCRPVSYRLMGIRARQIAALLGRLGVTPGDRVLILSENRPEWPLSYFGIALAGAVSVPALTGFSAEQIRHICEHAGVSAVCVSRALAAKIEPLPADGAAIPLIFIDSISDTGGGETSDALITISLDGAEKELALRDPDGAAWSFPQRNADDLASIVYTSGTLGCSKGVMLSNRNLISCARASQSLMPVYPRDRLLSTLPLAHTYECSLGLLTAVMNGAKISYLDRPPAPSTLLSAAKALRPTCMVTVPLLIEKICRHHAAPALRASPLYRFPLTRPLALFAAGRRLNAALGGAIRFFGIGGAPLSPETEDFLRKARFPYAPGYGLTETAPLVAGTAPFRFPLRSSGSIPGGLSVRITAEEKTDALRGVGEIQVRGPNVMMGYYRDEAQTKAAFTADGWLRTGDLGALDQKGRLYVKGRLKALILGPSGENIYPEEIEGLLNASQLVEDALVYPGEKGELIALVRVSENAKAIAIAQAAAQATVNVLERVLEELRLWANQRLASFSRLSRVELREEPFEKTPTFKIKRYLYRPSGT